jgi:hypothetical protein
MDPKSCPSGQSQQMQGGKEVWVEPTSLFILIMLTGICSEVGRGYDPFGFLWNRQVHLYGWPSLVLAELIVMWRWVLKETLGRQLAQHLSILVVWTISKTLNPISWNDANTSTALVSWAGNAIALTIWRISASHICNMYKHGWLHAQPIQEPQFVWGFLFALQTKMSFQSPHSDPAADKHNLQMDKSLRNHDNGPWRSIPFV